MGTRSAAVSTDPTSFQAKRAFDRSTKKFCEKLNELDCLVADSVLDQVTNVFVETNAPLNNLVQVATRGHHQQQQRVLPTPPDMPDLPLPRHSTARSTSPPSPPRDREKESPSHSSSQENNSSLTKQVELFRRHSRKLSQVASYAAQNSTNAKCEWCAIIREAFVDHIIA